MEKLDDFMRQKITGNDPEQSFEFREEYWLQAEALLMADERRRKRRALLFWWLSSTGVLLLLGVWAWSLYADKKTDIRPSQNGQYIVKDASSEPSETQENFTPVDPGSNREANVPPGSQESTSTVKHFSGTGNRMARTALATPPTAALAPGASVANITEPVDPVTGDPSYNQSDLTERAVAVATTSGQLAGLASLPQPAVQPESQASSKPGLNRVVCPSPVRKLNERSRWQWGLDVAGSAIARGNRDELRPGAAAGIFVQRRLTARWSAQVALGWRMIPYDYATELNRPESETLRYDFGFELRQQQLNPQALHWVELPITLSWQPRNVWVEAGVAPARLAGLRVQHAVSTYGSFDEGPVQTRSAYWSRVNDFNSQLEHFQYKKTSVSLLAGAGWQLTPGVSIRCRIWYRPGAMLRNPPADTPIDYSLDRSTFGVDAGLRFMIR